MALTMKKILFLILLLNLVFIAACGSKSKEELLEEGVSNLESGNYSAALVLLNNALEKDPNFVPARYQLGRLFLETEKYDRAEKEFQKVVRQNPANFKARLDLARVYLSMDQPRKAIDEVNTYLAEHPSDSEAYIVLGRAFFHQSDWPQSMAAFEKALEVNPEGEDARLGLARVLLAQNDLEGARRITDAILSSGTKVKDAAYLAARIARRAGDLEAYKNAWQVVLEQDPKDRAALYQLGLIALEQGDIEAVEDYAARLQRIYPEAAEGRQLEGFVLYQKGEFESAIISLQESLRAGEHIQTHQYLGLSYFRLNNLELALNHFQKMLDLEPGNLPGRILVGTTLLRQKRPQEAAFEAEKAIVLAPGNPAGHNLLGSALAAQGKYEEAMEAFDVAIDLDPSQSMLYVKKGLIEVGQGDLAGGEEALRQAVEVSSEVIGPRLLLADFLQRKGETDKALAVLEEGLNNEEKDALYLNRMAQIHLSSGNLDKVIETLEQAKKVFPSFEPTYLNLANLYVRMGEPEKALNEARALLSVDAGNLRGLLLEAALLEGLERGDEAQKAYRKAVESGKPEAYQALAANMVRNGNKKQALETVSKGLNINRDNTELLEIAGRLSRELGEKNQAIKYFERLFELNPDRGGVLLAASYIDDNQNEKALHLGEQAIVKSPENPAGYLLLAAVQRQIGTLDAALATLEKGIKRSSEPLALYLQKSSIQVQQGKRDQAMATLNQLVQNYPDSTRALFAKASLLQMENKKEEAASTYVQILSQNPSHGPSLNNLAYLYLEQPDKREQALQLAYRAYRLAPTEAAVLDTLGYALYRNGERTQARKVLEAAVARLDHPSVHFHLAQVYNDFGEKELARTSLQKALEHDSFPEKEDAQKLMQQLN